MTERINQLKDRILEALKKYTLKQKIIVCSLVAAIAIAIVLISYFSTRPVYVQLAKIDDGIYNSGNMRGYCSAASGGFGSTGYENAKKCVETIFFTDF